MSGEVWFEKRVNGLGNVTKEESKEVENMPKQTELTNGPARVVLEGVPRIGFDIGLCTFPASLRACMEFMGEDYSYDYIMGTSGAAFRLLWKPGWWLDNVDIALMADDLEPIRRALEAVGYTYGVILKEDFARHTYFNGEYWDDEAYFRSRIMESISDKGHPVIAFGVVGPPECSIITGYDEYGDVLIGWSFFQGSVSAPEPGVEYEPSGYYRKRNWFKDTPGIIIIGEKQERTPLGKTYRKALEWALKVMRTPMVHDRHNGFAAYNAWAEALLRDEDFSPGDAGIGLRVNVHNDALCMLDEHLCAARFLRQMAKDEPGMADELLAAAACYETENENSGTIDVLGKRITEPAIRRQFAELILQSRDKDEEAADHIERALTMEGVVK